MLLVVSTTLPCIFTALHILHAKRKVSYELKQTMLRVPTLMAFVLQLCLLQLAWSARSSAADRARTGQRQRQPRGAICLLLRCMGGFSRRSCWPRASYAMGGPRLVRGAGARWVPSPSGGHERVLRWQSESRLAVVLCRRHNGPRGKRVMSWSNTYI